jgi:hypothetical protein
LPQREGIQRSGVPSTKCKSPRRAGGVKGGAAAERSEGTLDAAEHRAIMTVAMALVL